MDAFQIAMLINSAYGFFVGAFYLTVAICLISIARNLSKLANKQ